MTLLKKILLIVTLLASAPAYAGDCVKWWYYRIETGPDAGLWYLSNGEQNDGWLYLYRRTGVDCYGTPTYRWEKLRQLVAPAAVEQAPPLVEVPQVLVNPQVQPVQPPPAGQVPPSGPAGGDYPPTNELGEVQYGENWQRSIVEAADKQDDRARFNQAFTELQSRSAAAKYPQQSNDGPSTSAGDASGYNAAAGGSYKTSGFTEQGQTQFGVSHQPGPDLSFEELHSLLNFHERSAANLNEMGHRSFNRSGDLLGSAYSGALNLAQEKAKAEQFRAQAELLRAAQPPTKEVSVWKAGGGSQAEVLKDAPPAADEGAPPQPPPDQQPPPQQQWTAPAAQQQPRAGDGARVIPKLRGEAAFSTYCARCHTGTAEKGGGHVFSRQALSALLSADRNKLADTALERMHIPKNQRGHMPMNGMQLPDHIAIPISDFLRGS